MDFPINVPGAGLVGGRFVDENAVTGQQGSLLAAQWGNQLTDEILNVIALAHADDPDNPDFIPSETQSNQMALAIQKLIADAVAGIGNSWDNLENKPPALTSLLNITTINSTTTLTNEQLGLILINAGTGDIAITLPQSAAANKAVQVTLMRIDTSSNNVTIKAATGERIDFNTDLNLLAAGDFITIVSSGGGLWYSVTPDATEKQKGLVRKSSLQQVISGEGNDVVTATTFLQALNSRTSIIYPNGTAENPYVMTRSQTIIIPNDFNTMSLLITAEVKSPVSGKWGQINWIYANSSSNGISAKCLDDGTIVIRSGTAYIYNTGLLDGNPFTDTAVTSAEFRLRITVLGG